MDSSVSSINTFTLCNASCVWGTNGHFTRNLNSDTKTKEDLANRFFIGTSFLVKPKEEKKPETESDEYLEMPPTPNINDLYDDGDESAWVNDSW